MRYSQIKVVTRRWVRFLMIRFLTAVNEIFCVLLEFLIEILHLIRRIQANEFEQKCGLSPGRGQIQALNSAKYLGKAPLSYAIEDQCQNLVRLHDCL